jgi:hypothetical protein
MFERIIPKDFLWSGEDNNSPAIAGTGKNVVLQSVTISLMQLPLNLFCWYSQQASIPAVNNCLQCLYCNCKKAIKK